jgi:POT family proton-dependent oligopeptide transporter
MSDQAVSVRGELGPQELERLEQSPPVSRDEAGHPTGFWFFFWGEFAERSSYYGMRAILPLYMTQRLLIPDDRAAEWYSYFKAACYLLPLAGGYLADRFIGKYRAIVGFSVPYVAGQLLIGAESRPALLVALVFLACGSGVTKPNISALMGMTYDQQRPGQTRLRADAFLWFYFAINVGSTLSLLLVPIVRNHLGSRIAFLVPAALMSAALAVFAAGRRFYAVENLFRPPEPPGDTHSEERRSLARLFGVFGLIVFFWVVYEHNDSLWVFFARDSIDLALPAWLGGGTLAPDQFQFVNAALILVLVPASQWFWARMDPTGERFPHVAKILIGLLFTAAAGGVMAAAGYLTSGGVRLSMLWILVAYLVLTIGEVLVYGTGLDLSYAQAPARMKGFISACFLLTSAAGNLINAQLAPLYNRRLSPASFFALDAAIALSAAVTFVFVGRRFHRPAEVATRATD